GNTNVGAADLSWTSGNNCTPIAAGSRAELLLDAVGLSKADLDDLISDLNSGKRISRNGLIYQIRDGQLHTLDESAQLKQNKQLDIEYRAQTLAQKSASWHITDAHWQQAREFVELAYKYAQLDGRKSLNTTTNERGLVTIGDWDLVNLVKQGSASAISSNDWWSLD
ncbi:replication endonuclease, partial [Pseudoalteromonas sp. NZS127]|nr:replication endonuclease [Pseudoalteromonas sp. NZS127]